MLRLPIKSGFHKRMVLTAWSQICVQKCARRCSTQGRGNGTETHQETCSYRLKKKVWSFLFQLSKVASSRQQRLVCQGQESGRSPVPFPRCLQPASGQQSRSLSYCLLSGAGCAGKRPGSPTSSINHQAPSAVNLAALAKET